MVDHPLETHSSAVLGAEDLVDAVGLQLPDLARDYDPTASAKEHDVTGALLLEQVEGVLEVFHVAALVGRDRHALDVLLDRRLDHFGHRAVVAKVNHLGASGLAGSAA